MTHYRLLLLFIIFVGFVLRTWQLPTTPPGLWYDEAYNVMDALWMTETGEWRLFMLGNNGREAMWHYLLLISTSLLGHTTFAVRWTAAVVGVLTIPLMYRFALLLSAPLKIASQRSPKCTLDSSFWFAVAAAGWVACSWWPIQLSRSAFRPILLPLLLILSLYFFWQGFQLSTTNYQLSTTKPYFILSGLFLGLSQYTYLSARLMPLIFAGLSLLWAIHLYRLPPHPQENLDPNQKSPLKQFGLGVIITAFVAGLIFTPLGFFFLNNPEAFSSRTGDVIFFPPNLGAALTHLGAGITLFLGAGHDLYRHHLPGRAMLGWLEILFFWVGLIWLLRPTLLRRPETQLILLGLVVMWLPALLASPPVHALRPVGIFPFYYLIVTIGLYQFSRLLTYLLRSTPYAPRPIHQNFLLIATITLTLTLFINTYDYFQRWSKHPEVYQEYNGPLTDLTQHLIKRSQTHDLLIPFHLYAHPTTRYLLQNSFTEMPAGLLPPSNTKRPTEMLLIPDLFQLLYVGNIPYSPAVVLLTQNKNGQGQIYVSRPPRQNEQQTINDMLTASQDQLIPLKDKLKRNIKSLFKSTDFEKAVFKAIYNDKSFYPKEKHIQSSYPPFISV